MRNEFEEDAFDYFRQVERLESRTGYSTTSALAQMMGESTGGLSEFSSSKHKVLSDGMPARLKAMNMTYLQMCKDNPDDALYLRMGFGWVVVNGKNISMRKRAAMLGLSSYSLRSRIDSAAQKWSVATSRLIARQKAQKMP